MLTVIVIVLFRVVMLRIVTVIIAPTEIMITIKATRIVMIITVIYLKIFILATFATNGMTWFFV